MERNERHTSADASSPHRTPAPRVVQRAGSDRALTVAELERFRAGAYQPAYGVTLAVIEVHGSQDHASRRRAWRSRTRPTDELPERRVSGPRIDLGRAA